MMVTMQNLKCGLSKKKTSIGVEGWCRSTQSHYLFMNLMRLTDITLLARGQRVSYLNSLGLQVGDSDHQVILSNRDTAGLWTCAHTHSRAHAWPVCKSHTTIKVRPPWNHRRLIHEIQTCKSLREDPSPEGRGDTEKRPRNAVVIPQLCWTSGLGPYATIKREDPLIRMTPVLLVWHWC